MHSDDEEERGAGARGYARYDRQEQQNGSPGPGEDANGGTGETTPENDSVLDGLPREDQAKNAFYNAASEKSLSHTESKLFYQRHQLETSHQEAEGQSPLARARTYSSVIEGEGGLSRATSTASRRSGWGYARRERNWTQTHPNPSLGFQSPDLNGADLPDIEDESLFAIDQQDGDQGAEHGTGHQSDMGDRPLQGSDISPELSEISQNIKKVLDIRHKYISLSFQGPNDNPKDGPDWTIYPPPPNPTWDDKNRPVAQTSCKNSLSNSRTLPARSDGPQSSHLSLSSLAEGAIQQAPLSPTVNRRKPGEDIGGDFDIADIPIPGNDEKISFKLDQGSVYQIYESRQTQQNLSPLINVPSLREYYRDLEEIQNVSSDGPTKSFAYRQLDILDGKFHLHFLVNSYQETADCKKVPHRDFYNVRKVDTHVHHSACMNQKHLLRFIKSKMKKYPDEIVMFRDNRYMTLKQVFESINLTAYDLSIDTLDMHVRASDLAPLNKTLTLEVGSH